MRKPSLGTIMLQHAISLSLSLSLSQQLQSNIITSTLQNSCTRITKITHASLTLYSQLWHQEQGWIVFSMSLGSNQVS